MESSMEGLIYKVQPYLESARLLFVYTPVGKKTLLAQGSQKVNHQNRILSQYLTHIEFKDQNKSFLTLSEAKIKNDFQTLKEDFLKTKSAAVILEIIDQLMIDHVPHEKIFKEMMDALHSNLMHEASLSFAIKVLKPLGYPLDLSPDGRMITGISITKGGIVYEGEPFINDIDVLDAISLLKLSVMPYSELMPINPEMLSRIKSFILKYYQYHLQTTLKNLQ
jgi:DNA repair protein RecO (recombination protein O)